MNIKGVSTLEKYERILNLRNYRFNTIKIYIHYVKEFVYSFDKPALHITAKDIQNYLINYDYSSVPKQNQIYSSLKLFAKHILHIKNIDKIIPERPRKQKALPKVIDNEYIKQCLLKISNKKHLTILSLGYSVGLRVSEVINLKIEDIDSKRMIIHIRNAKGGKDRIVPLSQSILILLREYFKEYKPYKYLFNGQKLLKYTSGSCNKIIKKYLGNKYHFHMLRHSSFTYMLENKTDISIIQKIAGHANPKTTQIYTQISTKLIKQATLPI